MFREERETGKEGVTDVLASCGGGVGSNSGNCYPFKWLLRAGLVDACFFPIFHFSFTRRFSKI